VTRGYFITGTDTGVGKTRVSLALMQLLQKQGHVVTGMKPVASGCRSTPAGLVNDDALQLQAQASFTVPYEQVNPYAFEPPIAPHLAAKAQGVRIDPDVIGHALKVLTQAADRVVVEGVGGWLVPIDETRTMADVAAALELPVIMVVGIRLGCLNHALLTAAAIQAAPVSFAGWVANRMDPDCEAVEENILALQERLAVPRLAELPYCAKPDESAARLEWYGPTASRPVS
jgi:dethiobiotin synthetase